MPNGEQQERSMEIPFGSAVITPNMMHQQLLDIGKKVDHLTSSFDPWQQEMRNAVQLNATRIAEITAERKTEVAGLDRRVRALENWRWFIVGLGAVSGIGATILIQFLFR